MTKTYHVTVYRNDRTQGMVNAVGGGLSKNQAARIESDLNTVLALLDVNAYALLTEEDN